MATSFVGSKSLAKRAPRVHLSSSSNVIPSPSAAQGFHPVSPLNDINGFEVPNVFSNYYRRKIH
jgi:hypothetical protein